MEGKEAEERGVGRQVDTEGGGAAEKKDVRKEGLVSGDDDNA